MLPHKYFTEFLLGKHKEKVPYILVIRKVRIILHKFAELEEMIRVYNQGKGKLTGSIITA